MDYERLKHLQEYVDALWKMGSQGVKVQMEMREVLAELKEIIRKK